MLLSEIESGTYCQIEGVNLTESLKDRLYEIGLKSGEKIKVIRKSYRNSPIIFMVKNTFFAIRLADAKKITAKVVVERD